VRIRVLTLNVQNDQGDPRRTRLVNAELRRLAPDLVALQEVCHGGHLAELIAGTGLRGRHQDDVLGHRPPGTERYGGTAVATRWPHRVAEVRDGRRDGFHHWTLAATVSTTAGDLLFVVPTTPWEPSAEPARRQQAAEVAALDRRHRGTLPTVVAGDLNAAPDSDSVRFLAARYSDAWAAAGAGPGHTWSVDNPLAAAEIAALIGDPDHRRRIDYVFAGPGARVRSARLVADRPVDGVWLSDHAGVLADLDLGGAVRRGGPGVAESPTMPASRTEANE
jgi:endonuclease/exonuclease/phosphatase family metal-dependent hydrolase